MQITVKDTNHSGVEYDLHVDYIENDSYNDVFESEVTSITYAGETWNIGRSDNGQYRSITLTSSNFMGDYTALIGILKTAGLIANISDTDNIVDICSGASNYQTNFHKDTSSSSLPYFMYKKEEGGSGSWQSIYTIGIYPSNQSSYENEYYITPPEGADSFNHGKIVAFGTDSDLTIYGLITVFSTGYLYPQTTITIMRNSGVNSVSYVKAEPSPDEKGFKPIKDTNAHGRGGGNKSGQTPNYESDVLTQPGAPVETSASIIGSGYVNLYKINKANLAQVGHCLFSDTLWTWFQGLTLGDPLDLIISLNVFPCSPNTSNEENVKLGKYTCSVESLGAVAKANPLSSQYKVVHFGTVNVGEMFESFLDYVGTSISLYLPFIGEVDIPICEVMGGSITVDYTIDFCTGSCTANVLCEKLTTIQGLSMDKQYSQHSYQGNCACQIPLSSASYGNMVGNLISAGCMALSGNAVGAVTSLATDTFTGGLAPTIKTKGNISANSGFCAVLYPYLTVIRPITAEPESFQEVMGYPSYMDQTLATCQGYCVCDNINLSGLSGATDNEINRIKQMCKEGIYI